jgi:hypothetical protein
MSKDAEHSADEVAATIRMQNDAFRNAGLRSMPEVDGRKVHTSGIGAYPLDVVIDIWRRVAEVKDFNTDNDPHQEHDFGVIDHPVAGRIFWKIDYYDSSYAFAAENPAAPSTRRVLTVMLAEEY